MKTYTQSFYAVYIILLLTFTFTLLFILEFFFYEDEQLVTGLFTINKSVSYYPSETRSIQLREWPPNLNLKITPSKFVKIRLTGYKPVNRLNRNP